MMTPEEKQRLQAQALTIAQEAGFSGLDSDALWGWAASNGHVDVVRLLLQAGADVNRVDSSGFISLFDAARFGHVDVVRVLLEAGADVNYRHRLGSTPLYGAALWGQLEVVRLLVQAGADVNWADFDGKTLLFVAAKCGHVDVVRVLLEAGAHVNQGDNEGCTPLHGAAEMGHVDAALLLALYGAQPGGAPETREMGALRELGAYLRAAKEEMTHSGAVSEAAAKRWEGLHASNPNLYFQLARLSPKLYAEETAYFGAYLDRHWAGKAGIFSTSVGFFAKPWNFTVSAMKRGLRFFYAPSPEPFMPFIRRAAIDYLKSAGKAYSLGPALSQAINEVLLKQVRMQADGTWELGKLAAHWTKYQHEPDAHWGTATQMWGLVFQNPGSLNDYRDGVLSSWLTQVEGEIGRDWSRASCGLPGEWDPTDKVLQTIRASLQGSQRLAEWARALILNREPGLTWDAFQQEIIALKAMPDYPLQKDLGYFFTGILQSAWELDNSVFTKRSPEEKAQLLELAEHVGWLQLESMCLESKPEKLDGFDADGAQAAYWAALQHALAEPALQAGRAAESLSKTTFLYAAGSAPAAGRTAHEEKEEKASSKRPAL